MKTLLRYLICAPWNLVICWPAILLLRVTSGKNLEWRRGILTCELRADSWFVRIFYPAKWLGTTLGHGIFYNDGRRGGSTEVHELAHVQQFEAHMLMALIQGLCLFAIFALAGSVGTGVFAGLGCWFLGFLWMLVPSWIQAWLAKGDIYFDSFHERAAYAIEDKWAQTKDEKWLPPGHRK